MADFKCTRCKARKPINTEGATGYATRGKRRICYACASELEAREMERTGRATLYLTESSPAHYCGEVTDWPGTLRFEVLQRKGGRHNIGRTRVDVWFKDRTGARWHGVHIGENNSMVRCKRLAS
jgi:hypothetical protein